MIGRILSKSVLIPKYVWRNLPWSITYSRFWVRGHSAAWNIFTHLTRRELLLLYWLGLSRNPGSVFLEIGSYLGGSACFLAAAANELGSNTKVYCVDTWKNDGMTEGARDTYAQFRQNTKPYQDIVVPLIGYSTEVARQFERHIDLLFVDGDHSYEACRADVLAWLPKVKHGGVVVMHDYGWATGVQTVVKELLQPVEKYPGNVFENTYWTLTQ